MKGRQQRGPCLQLRLRLCLLLLCLRLEVLALQLLALLLALLLLVSARLAIPLGSDVASNLCRTVRAMVCVGVQFL